MGKVKSVLILIIAFCFCNIGNVNAGELKLDNKTIDAKDEALFTLSINFAQNEVAAFGLDIQYNPEILLYDTNEDGSLVQDFMLFDVVEISSGQLRIGGLEPDPYNRIMQGDSGDLVTLYFTVLKCGNTDIQIVNLKDDFKGWNSENGSFICEENEEDETEEIENDEEENNNENAGNDNCPDDPAKTEPGECGCGIPDLDTDNDGTFDCNDNCPDDPAKTEPGECGCGIPDIDTNNDGTVDCKDNCPDDPEKTVPGECGCGIPDIDTDKDGTVDCNDNCPDDPAKTEPGECGCGVPDIDTDKDGTIDCKDNCPDDAEKTVPGECGCGIPDIDTDKDGTVDCNDNCPDDPAKTEPGESGCGFVDTDEGNQDIINNNPPEQPELFSPTDGQTDILQTHTLQTKAFSDPDTDDTHKQTQWQISTASDFSSLILDTVSSEFLTAFPIQENILSPDTKYYWRVKFIDNQNAESEWSTVHSFSTIAPAEQAVQAEKEEENDGNDGGGGGGCFIMSLSQKS